MPRDNSGIFLGLVVVSFAVWLSTSGRLQNIIGAYQSSTGTVPPPPNPATLPPLPNAGSGTTGTLPPIAGDTGNNAGLQGAIGSGFPGGSQSGSNTTPINPFGPGYGVTPSSDNSLGYDNLYADGGIYSPTSEAISLNDNLLGGTF